MAHQYHYLCKHRRHGTSFRVPFATVGTHDFAQQVTTDYSSGEQDEQPNTMDFGVTAVVEIPRPYPADVSCLCFHPHKPQIILAIENDIYGKLTCKNTCYHSVATIYALECMQLID